MTRSPLALRSRPFSFALWIGLGFASAAVADSAHPTGSSLHRSNGRGPVLTGLDQLVGEKFARLADRKVGLITNHTAQTADGRGIVEVFRAADGFELVALFSPEHGFFGALDQAEIGDSEHRSGLKIYSLYGKTRRPTDQMLEGIDTLVFDIQDIGCRFYTYVSTMGEAMRAAAQRGIRFLVLDRPNPLGGRRPPVRCAMRTGRASPRLPASRCDTA